MEEDAWHEAMMRKDVAYGPMVEALARVIEHLGPDAPAHLGLALTREFLVFVDREKDGLAARWERHERRLLRENR